MIPTFNRARPVGVGNGGTLADMKAKATRRKRIGSGHCAIHKPARVVTKWSPSVPSRYSRAAGVANRDLAAYIPNLRVHA